MISLLSAVLHVRTESESEILRIRSEQHHVAAVWFNEAVLNRKFASFTVRFFHV